MPRVRLGIGHVVNNDYTHWEMNDASESEWKKWTWRSQGDLFKRGAFFVESGDPNGVSKFGCLDETAPRPGKAVKSLTRYAGVIGCKPGVPKMSDDLRSATTDEGDEVRDYDQGYNDESLLDSAGDTGPSAEIQSEPSTSRVQNQTNPPTEVQANPTAVVRRESSRQRRSRGRSSGRRRGRGPTGSNSYRAFFASEDALRDFRESFQVPADVELELIPLDPNTHRLPQRHETVVPIFAICAAGLRFPIQTFTSEFLHVLEVTPAQLSLNTFRIINGIAELKKLHNLEFTFDDLFGIYYIGQNPMAGRIFLSPRSTERIVNLFSTYGLPITSLPDWDKYANDFVFRYANWQRIETLFQVQNRAAPTLLGYVPNYDTTLDQRWRQRRADKLAAEEIRSQQVPNDPPRANTSQLQPSAPHSSALPPLPSHPLRGSERLPLDRDSPDPFSSTDDIMGRRFTPKSLLYTTGVPAAPVITDLQPQANPNADSQPSVSEQERRKRRRESSAEGSRTEISSDHNVGNVAQSSLSGGGAEDQERTGNNPDDIPWSPRLSYCGRRLKRFDSIRDTPGLSLALLKSVELPKDMARVEKEGGDAFVVATHHMFSVSNFEQVYLSVPNTYFLHLQALQEMTSIRDGYNERNKLLSAFEKKVKDLTDENARLKEESAKARADASSATKDAADNKKALDELGQKYTEAIQKATSLQVEVDKIPNALKAKEDESWDEAEKTITKAYEDQVPGLLQYGCQFGWKAALEAVGVPATSPLYNEVPLCPRPTAPGPSTSSAAPISDPKEIHQVTRDVPTIHLDGQPIHEEPLP
ncbi:hypothetical protein Vadar_002812 [Vaccinium darrowii]|uniref:Uncharacterized protein n=1 Tax=Vaccinium darrowii TaxID=229202 RepID=A0ACB7XXH3_9ERIC|nr:hypothetical protein Vadar_002812 [Vaccinium darrowii]